MECRQRSKALSGKKFRSEKTTKLNLINFNEALVSLQHEASEKVN